jgi:hypothetical protein
MKTDDAKERWFRLSSPKQMLNIGGEVYRALEWEKQDDGVKMQHFAQKAISYLELSKLDPKKHSRVSELEICVEALRDYF